ncbi:MAG: bifunctional methylenetetrahydrofolate dehydrogenase/methenyltetrahydrofolate cyclohydrolase [Candidatus Melainabacteria bacterium RIFOXYA12_FULL_32_12]|nr:MAG: bifunctional methylenetetrahydrofolate dehydrogenase/methenyltetrahydrofolate cyclohydrolase [Candidatus Melainabacteria bacterium RIFOXYA2_FULL_32_9]OGI25705.1 MAG: bifunctional methylenetetrahydrofolate dehydrogenase/methenyltetrahydrofolate cyclohydrolase [Candidatus Melainabacteria bacterium RIFOXYA12_FULL_32_12]
MATLIQGKEVAQKIRENIKNEVANLETKPSLVVIIVGNNPASKVYVGMKEKAAQEVGINSTTIRLDENISQQELENKIEELNQDKDVNAILVQLPLPKHINTDEIIEKILPEKDVDGFHPVNMGKLVTGLKPDAVPCTPAGVMKLLEEYNIDIESKNAVVIGRSNIVGKPVSILLLDKNATVTICHSRTRNLKDITSQADILIAAVGRPELIKGDFVKEGAVVIDVGVNRTADGKLVGDVDFDEVEPKAGYITPVPGGVGPMTIAMLLSNTLNLYKNQVKQS